jgi:hypothetical protein
MMYFWFVAVGYTELTMLEIAEAVDIRRAISLAEDEALVVIILVSSLPCRIYPDWSVIEDNKSFTTYMS